VAAVTALPSVIPLSPFIPDVERAISQRIRQPVSIKRLRFFVLPTPHLRASTVSIGRNGLLDVDAVIIYPSLPTLFSDTKIIREVEVRGVKARFELLGAARMLMNNEAQRKRASSDEDGAVVVRRVTLRDVTLRFPTFELAGLNVEVRLQDGKPSQITASHQRDHLQVSAPAGGRQLGSRHRRPRGAVTPPAGVLRRGPVRPPGCFRSQADVAGSALSRSDR